MTFTSERLLGAKAGYLPGWLEYLNRRMPGETIHPDDEFPPGLSTWTHVENTAITETIINGYDMTSLKLDESVSGYNAFLKAMGGATTTPLTIEIAFHWAYPNDDSNVLMYFGPCFASGTTTGSNFIMYRMQDSTSTQPAQAVHGTLASPSNLGNLRNFNFHGSFWYMRLVWSAANTFQAQLSTDGEVWHAKDASLSSTFTPTHYGVAYSTSGAVDKGVALHYFRVYESDLSV